MTGSASQGCIFCIFSLIKRKGGKVILLKDNDECETPPAPVFLLTINVKKLKVAEHKKASINNDERSQLTHVASKMAH